jgi:hypothetical protein
MAAPSLKNLGAGTPLNSSPVHLDNLSMSGDTPKNLAASALLSNLETLFIRILMHSHVELRRVAYSAFSTIMANQLIQHLSHDSLLVFGLFVVCYELTNCARDKLFFRYSVHERIYNGRRYISHRPSCFLS